MTIHSNDLNAALDRDGQFLGFSLLSFFLFDLLCFGSFICGVQQGEEKKRGHFMASQNHLMAWRWSYILSSCSMWMLCEICANLGSTSLREESDTAGVLHHKGKYRQLHHYKYRLRVF